MSGAEGKRVCAVTGPGGFVGGYLMPVLAARGWQTLPMGRAAADFSDPEALAGWLARHGVTDIVHLAAESNPAGGDTRAFYETNAFLTERLLQAAATAGLPGRFLLVSATSVYGDSGAAPQREDDPKQPPNHYGASKLLAEVIAGWYRDRLDITIARPSNCMGAGQNPRYLVPKLVRAFAERAPEIAMGDTAIARDFVDIRDAADILAHVLEAPARSLEAINVSSGRATPIAEILDTLTRISGHAPEIRRDERFIRKGDMRFQACDTARARSLGHVPRHDLANTLGWMLDAATRSVPEPVERRLP
ncbi:NAD-dependent epimerase/dehydratase family protein [Rhodovulum visakhapatnamense]|uniref:Nucleoside-diphosphate-sugar epimerase n=1 Tax=Rhodovulum visakhapatnamense TaxID=364297 RepID=A0A4R8G8T1_9RHOB|nr:NAD-dependent epimerase/dehydratase family protein [Rhodovulum visakhapatnamense]TDX33407.1 nucleoside-diphosphate-sugar epimerase [Rhodovulum visakhapatnamense]